MSLGDPILDAQAICQAEPVSEEELTRKLLLIGWHPELVPEVIKVATGTFIQKGPDGKFAPRDGSTLEVVKKVIDGRG